MVIPGVAADMKLGDVMKAENAQLGISFAAAAAPRDYRANQTRLQGKIRHALGGRGRDGN